MEPTPELGSPVCHEGLLFHGGLEGWDILRADEGHIAARVHGLSHTAGTAQTTSFCEARRFSM